MNINPQGATICLQLKVLKEPTTSRLAPINFYFRVITVSVRAPETTQLRF